MEIRFQLSGIIEVPDGSQIEDPRTIRLPDGNFIKLWTGVELNDVDDLSFAQQQNLGVDVSDNEINLILEDDYALPQ